MRSTTLKGEPILHIHSLRYYLYTIYIVLTLIHVYDAWFDIWLMICESPWDEALLLSTSITAVALVSNGWKLGGSGRIDIEWRGFLFFFYFQFLSLGAEWWELFEGFGLHTSLYLTDICKSPISRGCNHGEDAVRGPETPAGCNIIVDVCSCLGGMCVCIFTDVLAMLGECER